MTDKPEDIVINNEHDKTLYEFKVIEKSISQQLPIQNNKFTLIGEIKKNNSVDKVKIDDGLNIDDDDNDNDLLLTAKNNSNQVILIFNKEFENNEELKKHIKNHIYENLICILETKVDGIFGKIEADLSKQITVDDESIHEEKKIETYSFYLCAHTDLIKKGGKKPRPKKSKKRSATCKRNTKCRRTMRKKRNTRK